MNRAERICIWIGGGALLAAVATDTLAVIGRQVGLPLSGSIELMQALVLVSGAVGILLASVAGNHARVRLLIDRLSPKRRQFADRFSDSLTLIFLLAALVGSVWLAIDMWDGHERSEVLGVPWWLLRMIVNLSFLAICAVLVRRIIKGAADD